MTSQITALRWLLPQACAGGCADLLIITHNVAEGSAISLSLLDANGKTVGSTKGIPRNNQCTVAVKIPSTLKDKMFVLAELSDHKVKLTSGPLLVLPQIQIAEVKIFDSEGKEQLDYIPDGGACRLKATINGVDGDVSANWRVRIILPQGSSTIAQAGKQVIHQGAFETDFLWTFGDRNKKIRDKDDRDMHGEKYENPQAELMISLLGVTATSAPIPIKQCMVLRYFVSKGQAGAFEGHTIKVTDPAGKVDSKKIPANGEIRVEQSLPGLYSIDENDVADLR